LVSYNLFEQKVNCNWYQKALEQRWGSNSGHTHPLRPPPDLPPGGQTAAEFPGELTLLTPNIITNKKIQIKSSGRFGPPDSFNARRGITDFLYLPIGLAAPTAATRLLTPGRKTQYTTARL